MKKIIVILYAALCLLSCSSGTDVPVAGKCIGEIYVTARSGAKSVLVDLPDLWSVKPQQEWISTDVNGRKGNGAFTIYYGSNESDFVVTNATRRGAVVIQNLTTMVADTVYIVQQGTPDGREYSSSPQDSYIEFVDTKLTRLKVTYANFRGCTDNGAVSAWLAACKSDVIAFAWTEEGISGLQLENLLSFDHLGIINNSSFSVDRSEYGTNPHSLEMCLDGKVYEIADFDPEGNAILQLTDLLNRGYNRPDSETSWLIGGSFYYLSAMETGYPDTPSWYPTNPSDVIFEADRYAQSNNLTDCIWMSSRKFNPTFSSEGKSWRADYAYASYSVWNTAIDVKVNDIPLSGICHKSIDITIKY